MKSTDRIRALLVAILAVLAFSAGVDHPWMWDDRGLLPPRLKAGDTSGLVEYWRQPLWAPPGPPDHYRPLALSLMHLQHRAFGDAVWLYRAASFLLHAGVSALVLSMLTRLAGPGIGLAGALLFAVHPVHAEAVAMFYGQFELLSTLFILLAVHCYLMSRGDGTKPAPFALCLLFFFLALVSKEGAAMLPALLVLVRALWMTGNGPLSERSRCFMRGVGWDLLCLPVLLLYLALRANALGSMTALPNDTITSVYDGPQRVKAIVVAVSHALRLSTVPTGQTVYYGHLRDAVFGTPVNELVWLAFAAMALLALATRLGWKPVFFGAGWFFIALLPVSNLVPSGVLVGERNLYLPSVGICFLGGAAYAWCRERVRIPRWLVSGALGVVVAGYLVASTVVMGRWRNEETLWRTTVAAHPRSPAAHLWLGQAMMERWRADGIPLTDDELREASHEFATAYRLNPNLSDALALQNVVEQWRHDLERNSRP
jgi:protein O-mannosyl-transferase